MKRKKKAQLPEFGLPPQLPARPSRPSRPSLLATADPSKAKIDEQYKKALKQWNRHCALILSTDEIRKLGVLLERYSVANDDPNRWFMLALRLAHEFVPGFAIAERRPAGRQLVWDLVRLYLLWLDVQLLRGDKPNRSVSGACHILAKCPQWKGLKGKTLQTRYEREAKHSPLVELARRTGLEPKAMEPASEHLRRKFLR